MVGGIVTHQSPVTLREVTPIARLLGENEAVVVPANSPLRDLGDLVAALRKAPESISWGGGSAGGTDQDPGVAIAEAIGVDPRRVNYIAYSGGGEAPPRHSRRSGVSRRQRSRRSGPDTLRRAPCGCSPSRAPRRIPGLGRPDVHRAGRECPRLRTGDRWSPRPGSAPTSGNSWSASSRPWCDRTRRRTLERYRWNDRYLGGTEFARFSAAEEARVEGILARAGHGSLDRCRVDDGRGPLSAVRPGRAGADWPPVCPRVRPPVAAGRCRFRRCVHHHRWRARSGTGRGRRVTLYCCCSIPRGSCSPPPLMFWLTARAFDASPPGAGCGLWASGLSICRLRALRTDPSAVAATRFLRRLAVSHQRPRR